MAEQSAKGSAVVGWLKAGVTSTFGLVSGAVLMYVTPLFNNAVKPPEPVANFGYQAQGLVVTFQNRANGATDGWWDFGDGSPLEPFSPKQDTVAHTYAHTGSYSVKLSLSNVFNEKSDRTVNITLDPTTAPGPVIEQFQVIPLSPAMAAPAVFRIIAKVKNTDLLVWSSGEARPIEVSADTAGVQERWVTVEEPGYCTFRLVAAGAKQTVEATSKPVWVGVADNGPTATVKVTYEAVQVDRKENVTLNVPLVWKADCKDTVCPVAGQYLAPPGYKVVHAEPGARAKDPLLQGLPSVAVGPDKDKVIVSGQMIRLPGTPAQSTPSCCVPVVVTLEKRTAPKSRPIELPMCLKVPGQTIIPIPSLSSNWQATNRTITLDLREGDRSIWSGKDLPTNRQVQLRGRPVLVNATLQGNQIVLTVTDPRAGLPPLGN
jgi:PKD repeat protein